MPIIGEGIEKFHLSHEEEDKLNEFQAITDFPENELTMVIKHLKNHSWNLEAALSRYFDGNWKDNLFKTFTPPPTTSLIENTDSRNSILTNINTVDSNLIDNNTFSNDNINNINISNNNNNNNSYTTVSLVPKLPIVYALPINFKDKFQIVGLNGTKNVHKIITNKTSSNIWLNQIWLVLLMIPNALIKLLQYIWSFTTGNRNGSTNNKSSKIMKIPKFPNHDNNTIDEDLKLLINDESKLKNLLEIIKDRKPFNESLEQCKDEFKYLLVILLGDINEEKNIEGNENANNNGISEETKENEKENEIKDNKNISTTQIPTKHVDINSMNFIKHILTDNGVLKILNDYKDEMIIYVGNVNEIEPWTISKQILNVKYTPECFLIGNVMNSSGSVNGITRLSVLNKLKITTPKRFQNSIKVTIDKFNPELICSRNEQNEIKLARQIKDAQELAYEESLMKDKLKDQQIQMEKINKRNLQMNKLIQGLNWCKISLDMINEGNKNNINNLNESKQTATLQIRNSNGERFIKKFNNDITLYELYCHVGCHIYLSQLSNRIDKDVWINAVFDKMKQLIEDNDENEKSMKDPEEMKINVARNDLLQCINSSNMEVGEIENLILVLITTIQDLIGEVNSSIEFNFELVSPFPRYIVPNDKGTLISEVSQIYPKGSLLIEDIVDIDESSEFESDSGTE